MTGGAERLASGWRPPAGGGFAALVGAGVSDSAGVATGEDLLRAVARRSGEDPGPAAVDWFRRRFGHHPDYFGLMTDPVAGRPGAPDRLPPGRYALPPGGGPTPAHRALAALAAAGLLGVVLTTNVDALLERAMMAAGVHLRVAADLAAMAALDQHPPGPGCTVVKLHGDYRDIGIRHTAQPDTYHPVVDRLLDRVLSTRDLLVAGWSAAWDVALGRALARPGNHRRTCWLLRGEPTRAAARLIEARDAVVVPVSDADSGLVRLARGLLASPGTGTGPAPVASRAG
jgi:hypothetical protein